MQIKEKMMGIRFINIGYLFSTKLRLKIVDLNKKRINFSLMIEASHIVKSYGSLNVIKDLSLAVKKGEIVAIVGPSGAGKNYLVTYFKHTRHPR